MLVPWLNRFRLGSLRLFVSPRPSQRHREAQRIDDGQDFTELASGFALFQFNDEPQTGAGRHGQGPLGYAQVFPSGSDQLADLFRCKSHESTAFAECYRTGIYDQKTAHTSEKFPSGNYSDGSA